MNNQNYLNTKKFYFLVLILFLIHFISGYPGGYTADSVDQFRQSLTGNYYSHHPPMMAMLWSIFNKIYQAPQTMYFMQISLLWLGVIALYKGDRDNKYRKYYFILIFYPMVLSQSTMVWKDIQMAMSIFFIVGITSYYILQKRNMPIYNVLGLYLVAFYACGVKFQAQYILLIIILMINYSYYNKHNIINFLSSFAITAVIILANNHLIDKYSFNSHSYQIRQFYDIAGVVYRIDDDLIMPDYVKKNGIYDFEKLKKNYSAKAVDPLFYDIDNKVYMSVGEEDKLDELNKAFIYVISNHPLEYLSHRFSNFTKNMLDKKWGFYTHLDENTRQQLLEQNINIYKVNYLYIIVKKYTRIISKFFSLELYIINYPNNLFNIYI